MSKVKSCKLCDKAFGIFRWRNVCLNCKSTFCSDCTERLDIGFSTPMCKPCSNEVSVALKTIKVVKSERVGGHKLVETLANVQSSNWEKNSQVAVENMKYWAYKSGANAVAQLQIHKNTHSKPGSGNGTHYYSVFKAEGVAIKIEKQEQRYHKKTSTKGNLAEQLEKLATMYKEGLLSQAEFESAKKGMLGS